LSLKVAAPVAADLRDGRATGGSPGP